MGEIEDEIARIAALRGKPAAWTATAVASTLNTYSPVVTFDPRQLFSRNSNLPRQMADFDSLPAKVRAFINDMPFGIDPSRCRYFLNAVGGDADAFLAELRRVYPQLIQMAVEKDYGSPHPNANGDVQWPSRPLSHRSRRASSTATTTTLRLRA